jgi:hypothetical protein
MDSLLFAENFFTHYRSIYDSLKNFFTDYFSFCIYISIDPYIIPNITIRARLVLVISFPEFLVLFSFSI